MEIRVNDMVEVSFEEHSLIGQVVSIHYALGQYDIQLPAFGLKRFPRNCIRRVVGREEETVREETAKQEDVLEIPGLSSYWEGVDQSNSSGLPEPDAKAADTNAEFLGGGGFSGGGGGDSWGSDSSDADSGSDSSSDSGSTSSE